MSSPSPVNKLTGQVKWFNRQTGWGFITILDSETDNDDIFVHWKLLSIFQYLQLANT